MCALKEQREIERKIAAQGNIVQRAADDLGSMSANLFIAAVVMLAIPPLALLSPLPAGLSTVTGLGSILLDCHEASWDGRCWAAAATDIVGKGFGALSKAAGLVFDGILVPLWEYVVPGRQ